MSYSKTINCLTTSLSDDGENDDAQPLPDHTEGYDQELHDYHWQPADNDGEP